MLKLVVQIATGYSVKPAPGNSPQPCGIIGVDIDDAAAMALYRASCPPTPVIITRGDHSHYYYRAPLDYTPIRQKTHIDGKVFNLDIRGHGGQLIIPGSIHKSGDRYLWNETWTDELLMSMPVYDPKWLPDDREEKKKVSVAVAAPVAAPAAGQGPPSRSVDVPTDCREAQASEWISRQSGTQQGSGADGRCFGIAMSLVHGFSLDEDTAETLLYEWGQRSDQTYSDGSYYPWSNGQIHHKISDALEATYRGTPGDLLDENAWLSGQFYYFGSVAGWDGAETAPQDEPEPVEEETPPYAPIVEEAIEPEAAPQVTPAPGDWRLYDDDELEELPDMVWQVGGHIPKNGTITIFGPSGAGKSFYAIDMAYSIATGLPFLGQFEVAKGTVLYLCAEGDQGKASRSKRAGTKAYQYWLNQPGTPSLP